MICPPCGEAADAGAAHACSTPGCTCQHRGQARRRDDAQMRCPYCSQPTAGGRAHIMRCPDRFCPAYLVREGDITRRCARLRGHYRGDDDQSGWHSENPAGPDSVQLPATSDPTWVTWSNWAEGALGHDE